MDILLINMWLIHQ